MRSSATSSTGCLTTLRTNVRRRRRACLCLQPGALMRRAYLPAVVLCLAFIAVSASPAATVPLTILKPAASDMEDATVPPSFTFVPGQVVFLSFEIGGYKVADDQRVHLSYKIDALDPKGVRLLDTISAGVDTTVSPEDKNWKPK